MARKQKMLIPLLIVVAAGFWMWQRRKAAPALPAPVTSPTQGPQ